MHHLPQNRRSASYQSTSFISDMARTCWNIVKKSFGDAKRDLRRISKQSWILGFLSFGFGALLVALILPSTFNTLYGDATDQTACVLDGEFSLFPFSRSFWSVTGFFDISLSFGKLTFGQAKIIDIIWDLVFGRGGQAVLAYLSWRSFARYMTATMELEPVTFSSFRAVFIEQTPSIYSIGRLIRDFSTRKILRSKPAMTFIVTSMIFVLSFPTLANSMSGYTTAVSASIKDYNEDTIPFKKFELLILIVHDGDRLNKSKDYAVTYQYQFGDTLPDEAHYTLNWLRRSSNFNQNPLTYIEEYGSTPKNSSSVYYDVTKSFYDIDESITLDPPTLNITTYFNLTQNFKDQGLVWMYSGDQYTQEYISAKEHGFCQSTEDYRWGFSFIQFFIVMMLLLLWSVGTLAMYMHAKHTMRSRNRTAIDGEHKAIINLAIAMNQELSPDPLSTKTEDEIKELVRDVHGGSISYSTSIPFEHQSKRRRFMEWIRNRKWFLAWIAVKLVILGLFPFYILAIGPCLMYALPGSIVGDFVVLLIGATSGSRFVLTLVPTFVSFLVSIVVSVIWVY
ncbi:unnamed protein product [Periconia digitata]|uniref:Uncharacterized protein n=1 Tax=Periconia digitata TaxID=1303443 RepID=A0A9W4XVB2_9PLEO|nr:unnamed protein product [Periconia digitata]